jgi:hypothetical protein
MLLDTLLGGGVGKLVQDVVGTFKLSPAAKAEFDAKVAENDFLLKQMDANLESKLQDTASANIQAEEKSGDKYTSRARPTFMYICELLILWNYAVVPLFKTGPVQLPDPLFWLFGSAILGYTGARTWEKVSGVAGK